MEFSVALRDFVTKYNPLETPTKQIRDYLLEHRTIYKIVLVANFILLTLMLYHDQSQSWNLSCAKAPRLNDCKRVNISNMDPLAIVQPRELSHGLNSNFETGRGIISPLSPTLGGAVALGLRALCYRLTIETNCIYKFSLPVYATLMSLWFVATAWTCGPLIASLSLIPLIASVVYIVCDIDFEANYQGTSCCSGY